ncbi:MAG: DUF6377 domain-containing protein [Bacteroidales bacterium]|nr:DUF6377 domain-containing protein [Bacteroidales bacterium]
MKVLARILVFGIALFATVMRGQATAATDSLLLVLDRELAVADRYVGERGAKITQAKHDLTSHPLSDDDAYNVLRTLFQLYHHYDIDSALWVAQQRLDVAQRLDDSSKLMSARLNLAEGSIAAGSYATAQQLLDQLDRSQMRDYHQRYAYQLYAKLYRLLALSNGVPSERRRYELMERIYADSLARVTESSRTLTSRQLINNALAALQNGDKERAKAMLTEASLIDIRSGRRDLESLMRLATLLCEEGDYERSYDYIVSALNQARAANAMSRTAEILQVAQVVEQAHNAMMEQWVRRLHVALWVIASPALVAIVICLWAIGLLRANRRANQRLQDANSELEQANRMKEVHISNLFDSHSRHIEEIASLRKRGLQLLRTAKIPQLEKLLSSHAMENSELQRLYTQFDEMYLSMYPHFIGDYNNRVAPEHRVDPSTRELTPELRVQALINMGITDSGSIARLLHYSPQTVYNYRSRLKLRYINPE